MDVDRTTVDRTTVDPSAGGLFAAVPGKVNITFMASADAKKAQTDTMPTASVGPAEEASASTASASKDSVRAPALPVLAVPAPARGDCAPIPHHGRKNFIGVK